MKKKSLTIEGLKLLLLVRFEADKSVEARMTACLRSVFGDKIRHPTSEEIAIKNKMTDWVSEILARRLLMRNRPAAILSTRDLTKFIPEYIDFVEQVKGEKLDVETRKILEKFVKAMFKNLLEMIYGMVPERRNLYDEYWQWITIVLDLATERGIQPIELLRREGTRDEIARRMYTKKQYVALYKKAFDKLINLKAWKKILINPIIDAMCAAAGLDAEESLEIRKGFEAEIMPGFRKDFKKLRQLLNAFVEEEVTRVYAIA